MNVGESLSIFKIKEYRSFIIARILFVFAIRMLSTCILFQIYQLTKSTYAVGLAGLAEFIPVTLFALIAGPYADKHNKRNILICTYVAFFLCGLALLFAQQLDKHNLLIALYSIMSCTGIIRSFAAPASNGMIAAMVSKEKLPQATGFNSQAWLTSSILGHATGGFIIATLGMQTAYAIISILFLSATIIALQILPKPPQQSALNTPMLQAIKEGFSFVWHTKSLLGVISLDLFAVLFGGAVAFIPEVCERILNVGPVAFGWLNAAIDIGGLISIIILTFSPMKKKQGLKMLIAVAVFGSCIIGFGFSKHFAVSFILLLIAGIADGISVVVRGVVMQMQTPDDLRGRVSSINSIFINSSNELGQFESGITSRLLGTQNAIVFGGCATLLVVTLIYNFFPKLKKLSY
jgi:MFS family permease